MALSGSVDFVIKATDLTSKPTQDIVSALQQLDTAQKGVIDSAGAVTRSTADLKTEQEALLKITSELDKRLSDVTKYEKNEGKIKELTTALSLAKDKYSEFSASLFNAQASSSKTGIDVATSNLKATNTVIRETQTQLDRLTRQQEKLKTSSLARGGVDLTQGGTARATTEAARDTVEKQKQLNIQLQLYKSEQEQEVATAAQAEAVKRTQTQETAAFSQKQALAVEQVRRQTYEKEVGEALDRRDREAAAAAAARSDAEKLQVLRAAAAAKDQGEAEQRQRAEYARQLLEYQKEEEANLAKIIEQQKTAAAAAAEKASQEKKAADQLERFQEVGTRANLALDVSKQGKTSATAPGASTSASTAVLGAIDPLKAQLSTLAGVETALTQVEAKIKSVGLTSGTAATKVVELTVQEKQLDQISKTLGAQAGFIDKLNTQNAAVDTARVRLAAAEAEVRKWASAIEQASAPSQAMLVFLQQAQGRLQGATTSFNTQNATLERLRAEAQGAGVNVSKLAQEEERLVSAAQRASAAQRGVGDALEQAGKKGVGLTAFLDNFNNSGRTTLSFAQRMRGEILSLAASYIGLQAAVRGAGAVLGAVNTAQTVKAQISQTSDNPEQAKAQYAFLLAEANRTSTAFETVAEGYRTMVRQAREFGLSQEATNQLFHDSLTVSRSYNQSQEQFQGTMLATGQIFDKTTIQAQEFKQQLSNAGLAGLFPALARVMEDQGVKSVADLRKAMAEGTISAANFGLVMNLLAKQGEKAFNENMKTWTAQVGRFKTQLFVLENSFADSGFLTGVSDGLDRVSQLLKDPATQENIKELGKLLGELISTFAKLATNADVLRGAFTALEVYLASKFIISIISTSLKLAELASATTGVTAVIPGLSAALGASSTLGLWGAAIGAGVGLGYLLDKIPAVHNEIERLANAPFWETLKENMRTLNVPAAARLLLVKGVDAQVNATAGRIDDLTAAPGQTRADVAARQAALDVNTAALRKVNQERKAILDQGASASEEDLARLKQLMAQTQTLVDKANLIKPPTITFITGSEKTAPRPSAPGDAEARSIAENKRLSQESGLTATTDLALKLQKETNVKLLKSQGDYLKQYQEQYATGIEAAERTVANARAAAAKDGSVANNKLLTDALAAQSKLNVAIKNRADLDYEKANASSGKRVAAAAESFEHKAVTLHEQTNALKLASDKQLADLGAKVEDDSLKARLVAVDAGIAQIDEKYAVQLRKNQDAIAAGKKTGSNTSQLQADNATIASLQKDLVTRRGIAEVIATQKFDLDQAKKAEEEINQKLQLRAALLSAIQEQQKAGLINSGQASERTAVVNTNTLGGAGGIDSSITAQVKSLTDLIDKQAAAGKGASAFSQKLQLLRAQMIALKAATDASAASNDAFAQKIGALVSDAATTGITSFLSEIGKLGAGVETAGKAWTNFRDTARSAIADLLQSIAVLIIKTQLLKAIQNAQSSSGGGLWGSILGATAGALGGGSKAHTGAVVGAGGLGGATPMNVNPAWFIGAPRFHTGGLPGLAPDEYPIIAQQGEEILSKSNPRNVLNGGADKNSSQVGAPGGDVNVHMHADAGSFFAAGLNSKKGQKDFFVFFEANRAKFSKLVK